ncbi:carboxylating nicotinate-nucleotide diphosphorylase [Saxibacter everestensis]|uniref:nicotinate-nucleotide diphosphorylase (carboxylating) n=1 Tax=Saxibacter everestensis TaxID=2909229 RepID=A0ABY8QND4_9MICO|nr:carboxylating nicotinate-nucleotide diphosphorylase [Brevibacteriaceae bacterium ZFBP1038]
MLTPAIIRAVVAAALLEDAPWGDITGDTLIPANLRARAELVAREPGVLSGGEVFSAAFEQTDPEIEVAFHFADGDRFVAGSVIATVRGPARGVLTAERVGLNFVQRMSGIATLTADYVSRVRNSVAANLPAGTTPPRLVDTRKTTPGLRAFERHAVRSGGGHNHRNSLSDAVMAKDNHLAILAGNDAGSLTDVLTAARATLGHTTHFEVEVDRIDQIEPVVSAGVDTIMLDNFALDELREGVRIVAGRALVEASGNVNLDTVGEIALTGVDIISVGALTHSVRSLDLGLDISVEAG